MSVQSLLLADAAISHVAEFLLENFDPVEGAPPELRTNREWYMTRYAEIANFLSTPEEFRTDARALSDDLASLCMPRYEEMLTNGVFVKGAFADALGALARSHDFSPEVTTLPREFSDGDVSPIFTLNGKVPTEQFADVVSRKGVLFRDAYTRPHGEYSHAIQWLCVAQHFGEGFGIPRLYKNSVNFECRTPNQRSGFVSFGGQREKITIWNFLVDCFPVNSKDGPAENYRDNIFSDTFRCPQYLTRYLGDPPATTFLPFYIFNKSVRGLGENTDLYPYRTPDGRPRRVISRDKEYIRKQTVGGDRNYGYIVLARSRRGTPKVLCWVTRRG